MYLLVHESGLLSYLDNLAESSPEQAFFHAPVLQKIHLSSQVKSILFL